jgi:hypothetical protein
MSISQKTGRGAASEAMSLPAERMLPPFLKDEWGQPRASRFGHLFEGA